MRSTGEQLFARPLSLRAIFRPRSNFPASIVFQPTTQRIRGSVDGHQAAMQKVASSTLA